MDDSETTGYVWEDNSFYSDEAKKQTQVTDSFTSSDDTCASVANDVPHVDASCFARSNAH